MKWTKSNLDSSFYVEYSTMELFNLPECSQTARKSDSKHEKDNWSAFEIDKKN